MVLHKRTLFLTLRIFSATGGIEKVCRVAAKAMYEINLQHAGFIRIFSMYDKNDDAADNKYFPSELFRGFGINKVRFIAAAVREGVASNQVILSHINLLPVGWLIKKIAPSVKLILFAHGIEVWRPLGRIKRKMLHTCDEIISVSNFTRRKIEELHHVPPEKCRVLNNCLDPLLPLPFVGARDSGLMKKYTIARGAKVLFSLTRLSSRERYKGYDRVMEAIARIKARGTQIHYILAGKYDAEEKLYIDSLIKKLGLEDNISLPGYIEESLVARHFAMADMYIMPSIKEGFGIVFIEAMYYGLPVIAGNMDGSADALCNGSLGLLVDPLNTDDIQGAIEKVLLNKNIYKPNRGLLMQHFSYATYKSNFEKILAGSYKYAQTG